MLILTFYSILNHSEESLGDLHKLLKIIKGCS